MSVSRREALALGVTSLGLLGQAAGANAAREIIPAELGTPINIDDIARGAWRQFSIDGLPVFVRRLTAEQMRKREHAGSDEWVVVSGICTHAGCTVEPGLGSYRGFACFCHGSEYDALGAVRRGPAKQNLPELCHRIEKGTLTILSLEPCRNF